MMNSGKHVNRFDLNNQVFVYQHIQTISTIQPEIIIDNRQWHLSLNHQPILPQLMRQAGLVNDSPAIQRPIQNAL